MRAIKELRKVKRKTGIKFILLGICGLRRPRSARASARADLVLRCPLTESKNTYEVLRLNDDSVLNLFQKVCALLSISVLGPIVVLFIVFLWSGFWSPFSPLLCLILETTSNFINFLREIRISSGGSEWHHAAPEMVCSDLITAPSSICFRRSALDYQCLWSAHRGSVYCFLVFWFLIALGFVSSKCLWVYVFHCDILLTFIWTEHMFIIWDCIKIKGEFSRE